MSQVQVYYCNNPDNEGIALQIGPGASLNDLLAAWQPLCDESAYGKKYASNLDQSCRGCTHNCCDTAYVIPDLIAFKKMAGHLGCTYKALVDNYFQPEKRDIGLLRMIPNPCVFLHNRLCSIYPIRALICRFYLCSTLRGDTEQLIYYISSLGMTATHVFARQEGLLAERPGAISSMDRLFLELFKQYAADPLLQYFLDAEEYEDIPLYPFMERAQL
ncbi:MAG: YkgJ family cysteine cluster protein [Syntrophomonadaceae bacterium]